MRFSLIKREPSYFFENIHEDLQRFLRDTFGDFEPLTSSNTPFERVFRPAVEIKECEEGYKIDVELTGVKKEDIDVQLGEDFVSITADSKFEKTEEKDKIKYTEFRYGKFSRQIPLEHKINKDSAECEFKDGVLKIKVKKETQPQEETKKLEIK